MGMENLNIEKKPEGSSPEVDYALKQLTEQRQYEELMHTPEVRSVLEDADPSLAKSNELGRLIEKAKQEGKNQEEIGKIIDEFYEAEEKKQKLAA